MDSYEDRVLLKLRRKYSKDETVAALNKKLLESDVRNGVLLDEIDFLKESIKEKDRTIKEINKKLNNMKGQISYLQKENNAFVSDLKSTKQYKELVNRIESTVEYLKKRNERLYKENQDLKNK